MKRFETFTRRCVDAVHLSANSFPRRLRVVAELGDGVVEVVSCIEGVLELQGDFDRVGQARLPIASVGLGAVTCCTGLCPW